MADMVDDRPGLWDMLAVRGITPVDPDDRSATELWDALVERERPWHAGTGTADDRVAIEGYRDVLAALETIAMNLSGEGWLAREALARERERIQEALNG